MSVETNFVALWRRAAKSGVHTPVVILLHGRGADEHDLTPLVDRLPVHFTYVSLRALVAVDGGGFTWFENRGIARPIAKSVRASAASLRSWIDRAIPRPAPCYLLGFSAGMMMAGALILEDPQRYNGAILLSGALALDGDAAAAPGRLLDFPVFYGRGSYDDVIPAALVARSESYLHDRSSANLMLREYDHAHTISTREINDIAAWLNERR